jgi:hypothetical protein
LAFFFAGGAAFGVMPNPSTGEERRIYVDRTMCAAPSPA